MINSKQNRFNQLLNSIEDGNPKTLSVRLREMEKQGLIKRKVYYNEKPIRVEYPPTEKGLAFQPILDTMAAYSLPHTSVYWCICTDIQYLFTLLGSHFHMMELPYYTTTTKYDNQTLSYHLYSPLKLLVAQAPSYNCITGLV
jgi:hypothetical protein